MPDENNSQSSFSIEPFDAPSFYGSSVRLVMSPQETIIAISRPHPVKIKSEQGQTDDIGYKPEAVFTLSLKSAKDLSIMLSQAIADHEKEWGPIETPMTRDASVNRANVR